MSALEIVIQSAVRALKDVDVEAPILNIAVKELINEMMDSGGCISSSLINQRYREISDMMKKYNENNA